MYSNFPPHKDYDSRTSYFTYEVALARLSITVRVLYVEVFAEVPSQS
jgi:hypothetical protein